MPNPGDLAFDFRSDTVTQPTTAMKAAMTDAPLGDDVYREDPTTNALQEKIAQITGMEAALFFPTGSMANLAALMSHTRPGEILFAGANSHIKLYELGSYARVAGLSLIEVDDREGALDLNGLRRSWPTEAYYMARPGLVAVENTHNMLGGKVYPATELAKLRAFTNEKKAPLHLDGARIFNAAIALDRPVTDWTRHVDSIMISLSKGLGAPAGSVLAGSRGLVRTALRMRKLLGGGMRQTGVLAAAGLHALNHHLPLLKRDHARCRLAYEQIEGLSGFCVIPPETNILILETDGPRSAALVAYLAERGVKVSALDEKRVRIVFHMHISDAARDMLVALMRQWDGQA